MHLGLIRKLFLRKWRVWCGGESAYLPSVVLPYRDSGFVASTTYRWIS